MEVARDQSLGDCRGVVGAKLTTWLLLRNSIPELENVLKMRSHSGVEGMTSSSTVDLLNGLDDIARGETIAILQTALVRCCCVFESTDCLSSQCSFTTTVSSNGLQQA